MESLKGLVGIHQGAFESYTSGVDVLMNPLKILGDVTGLFQEIMDFLEEIIDFLRVSWIPRRVPSAPLRT